jgi:hypothetical protein
MPHSTENNTVASMAFLESVPLARPGAAFEALSADELPQLPEYEAGIEQAVTVGSQISEFSKSVPRDMRPHIDNAFLLAQLAANFEIEENGGGTMAWYDTYIKVLENAGWVIESRGDALRELGGASLEVHKEIIPVITAALGPAAAAASVVVTALKGLQAMNADQPWITLFSRESQRASANQFQVSFVDVDENLTPRLTLASFELNASRSITQILFFKFSDTNATLSHFEAKMSINKSAFDAGKTIIAARLADKTAGFLTDLQF